MGKLPINAKSISWNEMLQNIQVIALFFVLFNIYIDTIGFY